MWEKIVYFLSGMVLVILLLIFVKIYKDTTKPEVNRLKELQKISNAKDFLRKVIPYLDRDKRLNSLIYKLESVEPKEFKKLKKEIITKLYTIISDK